MFSVNNNVVANSLSAVPPVSSTSVISSNSAAPSSASSLSSESTVSGVTVTTQSTATFTTPHETASLPPPSTQTSNVNFMTSPPVGMPTGVQPMITYSVVGANPKTQTLTVTSNQFLSPNPPLLPVNGHYIYHPNPLMTGAIPIHPSAVYPVLPTKPIIRNDLKPPGDTIMALTKGIEAVSLNEDAEAKSQANSKPLISTATKIEEGLEKIEKVENLPQALKAQT